MFSRSNAGSVKLIRSEVCVTDNLFDHISARRTAKATQGNRVIHVEPIPMTTEDRIHVGS